MCNPLFPDELKELVAKKEKNYGEFSKRALVAQAMKDAMKSAPNWETLSPVIREGLEQTAHKIAGLLCGNPHYEKTFLDIQTFVQMMLAHVENCNDKGVPAFRIPLGDIGIPMREMAEKHSEADYSIALIRANAELTRIKAEGGNDANT